MAASLKASRRAGWIVAGCAAVLAMVEALALGAMFPLRTVAPYTLTQDRRTGVIDLSADGAASRDDLRLALAEYVIRRESYDGSHPRDGVAEVLAASQGSAARGYADTLDHGAPRRVTLLYTPQTRVDVVVERVAVVSPGVAKVTFKAARREGAAPVNALPWVATLAFIVDTPSTRSQPAVRITKYQRDAAVGA